MTADRQLWADDNMNMLASLATGSARLVYLDPPFNSGRSYEALLGVSDFGTRRRDAFVDSWRWDSSTEESLAEISQAGTPQVAEFLNSIVRMLGRCDLAAYLVMIAPRLVESHRTLSRDGALFLHCDPSASHYLKILMDMIFEPDNFRNEIVWKRTHAHSGSRRFGPVHDTILFYSRSREYVWNQLYSPYSDEYIEKYFRNSDDRGRYQLITCTAPGARPGTRAHYAWRGIWPPSNRHLAWTADKMEAFDADDRIVHSANGIPRFKRYEDDGEGTRLQDLWLDINPLSAHSGERTGYETQKPRALLSRIIEATTSPGDLVIDPFGGSGTSAVAAESLGRRWQVADISLLASSLSLSRLRVTGCTSEVELHGFPSSEASARQLRNGDPISYAVWGTAMLETLLDKKETDPDLASGNGDPTAGGLQHSLRSWVPLSDHGGRREVLTGHPSALFLPSTRKSRGFADALTEAGVNVRIVELDSCVSKRARSAGSALAAA